MNNFMEHLVTILHFKEPELILIFDYRQLKAGKLANSILQQYNVLS